MVIFLGFRIGQVSCCYIRKIAGNTNANVRCLAGSRLAITRLVEAVDDVAIVVVTVAVVTIAL